jgi:hypothetical protein
VGENSVNPENAPDDSSLQPRLGRIPNIFAAGNRHFAWRRKFST